MIHIKVTSSGWRDDSRCFYRGSVLDSQHPHDHLHSSVTLASGDLTSFSGSMRTRNTHGAHIYIYTNTQTHTQKK